jgi:two pore calcium channel protein
MINFNDFGASVITLFTLMVVSNWTVISLMYEVVMETKLVRIYFIIFYLLSVTVILNIVIAFVLEIY